MSDIERERFNEEFKKIYPYQIGILGDSIRTIGWAVWKAAKQDVQVNAKELLEEVKQLCRDYSSRTNLVYVGDVLAQLDDLYERLAQPPKEQS